MISDEFTNLTMSWGKVIPINEKKSSAKLLPSSSISVKPKTGSRLGDMGQPSQSKKVGVNSAYSKEALKQSELTLPRKTIPKDTAVRSKEKSDLNIKIASLEEGFTIQHIILRRRGMARQGSRVLRFEFYQQQEIFQDRKQRFGLGRSIQSRSMAWYITPTISKQLLKLISSILLVLFFQKWTNKFIVISIFLIVSLEMVITGKTTNSKIIEAAITKMLKAYEQSY